MLKSPALPSLTLQSNGQIDPQSKDCEETGYKPENVYKLTIYFIRSLEKQFRPQVYDFKFFRKNRAQAKFIEFFLFSQMGAPGSQPDRCLFLWKSGHRHLCCFTSDHMLQETPASTLLPETRSNCYLPSELSLTSTTRISPSLLLPKNSPLFLVAQSLTAFVMTNQTLFGLFYNYLYTYLNLLLNYFVCVCYTHKNAWVHLPVPRTEKDITLFSQSSSPFGLDWLASELPGSVFVAPNRGYRHTAMYAFF